MPAPSVIRAERSLHPQRHEPGWLETPCPERGSCRTVGDPRLRQLAADTGDHATGRSAARFAPPWEIPRGGANRRSVDRFIPRLWGNIGPAWSPSMSIPAHPHTRGEHGATVADGGKLAGSSPHLWGTQHAGGPCDLGGRFIPTPVGNTRSRRVRWPEAPVHPHTRGEHLDGIRRGTVALGSSPHPWGTRAGGQGRHMHQRFIPTPVGNTRKASRPCAGPTVHPHTRGEHADMDRQAKLATGSSPHPWGTLVDPYQESFHCRFIPTPVGNTLTVSHCFKKRKTTAKFHRAKRPSRRSWK